MVSSNTDSTLQVDRPAGVRQKRWAPKVKTGCLTCRIRRVKCDEGRPSCQRCVGTGRRCDGYEEPCVASMPSVWDLVVSNDAEKDNFRFFQAVTTSNLAGFFDFGFWSRHVLQVSHSYPALWHATTALAFIHRKFISDNTPVAMARVETNRDIEFALKQFNKSIQSLTPLLSKGVMSTMDKFVVLTTCILYASLSSMQGLQRQAFMHINNGLKLFQQWKLGSGPCSQPDERILVDMLLLILTRLDTQVRPYLVSGNDSLHWTENKMALSSSQRAFVSLLQAYVALEVLFNGMMQLVLSYEYHASNPSPSVLEEKEMYIRGFSEWDQRLAAYIALSSEGIDRQALDILYVRRIFARVFLAFNASEGQLAHDRLIPEFVALLNAATRVLDNEIAAPYKKSSQPMFSLGPCVVDALWWIGVRCREPNIRRQALQLLWRHPRREGICEGMLAAKVTARVIELEETGCPTYSPGAPVTTPCTTGKWVCEIHRVVNWDFVLVKERQVCIVLKTVEDLIKFRSGTEVWESWW